VHHPYNSRRTDLTDGDVRASGAPDGRSAPSLAAVDRAGNFQRMSTATRYFYPDDFVRAANIRPVRREPIERSR